MILEYGGKNCWAFKDWMEISFRVNNRAPSNIAFKNKRVVPVLGFEGGNAAGKSCALRVLSFIVDFCSNSFNYITDSPILFDTYFNNTEPSQFYISFCLNNETDLEYKYEVKLTREIIISEKLTCKSKDGSRTLFKRLRDKIKINEICENQTNIIYKPTASFISTMIQYGVNEIGPIKSFFSGIVSNVFYTGTYDDSLSDYSAKYYFENPDLHKRVIRKLREWDTGIKSIEIVSAEDNRGNRVYFSVFHHDTDTDNNMLSYQSQSTGTKLLYNRLKDFYMVLEKGGVLIFDELDNHLHASVVPMLIELFIEKEINTQNAQLIFTSHNTELLDTLKKYRIYLFKKIKGESICYRVDEIPNNSYISND